MNEIVQAGQRTMSFSELKESAEVMAKSGLFPQWNTSDKMLSLMLLCESEGSNPLAATQRFDCIQGRIAKKPQAMLADFIMHGGKVEWTRSDNEAVEGIFTTPQDIEHIETWTIEDARRAGLVRPGSGWAKFPKAMLRARCISFALRAVFPVATGLMYTPEELSDGGIEQIPAPDEKAPTLITGEESKSPETKPETEVKKVPATKKPKVKQPAKKVDATPKVDVADSKQSAIDVKGEVVEPPKKEKKVEKSASEQAKEFLATLDLKKLDAFLKTIHWPPATELSEAQLITIGNKKDGFQANVEKMKVK